MEITPELVGEFRAEVAADVAMQVAQNAVCSTAVNVVALNRQIVQETNTTSFSVKVDNWSVTNQKSSGRCWLFATLNVFRIQAMKTLKVKDFEFSQSYIHFWDKFERSNHFLEAIIQTSDRPIDDRTIAFLLGDPIGDGGQWCMAINLIRKHGLVPKSVFPESVSSSATLQMNGNLKDILRSTACELREIISSTGSWERAREHKVKRLRNIWRFLCIHLGTPPSSFKWQWTDKNDKFHRIKDGAEVTPLEFFDLVSGGGSLIDPEEESSSSGLSRPLPRYEDYYCLVNDPRNPYMETYTVDFLQSVVGGPPVIYLNVDIQTMKTLTRRQLEDGLGVWMGCDVGKQLHRESGIWDNAIFQYPELYGFRYGMNKTNRLLFGQTLMTHAMMFTGVDICDDKPTRWRVENSWGDGSGVKGFYTMNDNWFDEHMFEIAVPASYLSPDMLDALHKPPTTLPAWDPMGSLALHEA